MRRFALTIVELLVVIAVILFLLCLLLPALSRSSDCTRISSCQSNLRYLSLGFQIHAMRDSQTRFCTGAYDWRHDGCPDSVGWIADLVNMNVARPIDLLCPVQQAKGNEQLMELYGKSYDETDPDNPESPLAAAGICGTAMWGGPATTERTAAIEKYILDGGYSSNYTASWYLVRGEVKCTAVELRDAHGKCTVREWRTLPVAGRVDWRNPANSTGPLRRKDLDHSAIPSSIIPLLGDGAPDGVAPVDLQYKGRQFVLEGDSLVASYNAGPATFDGRQIVPLPGNTMLGRVADLDNPDPFYSGQLYQEATGWRSGKYGSVALQDTRGWCCCHLEVRCCLLMADGSVQTFPDVNGDRLLNPGFPAPDPPGELPDIAPEKDLFASPATDYVDGRQDLPRANVFSGIRIRNGGGRMWNYDGGQN
jgi:hypothetical protein